MGGAGPEPENPERFRRKESTTPELCLSFILACRESTLEAEIYYKRANRKPVWQARIKLRQS